MFMFSYYFSQLSVFNTSFQVGADNLYKLDLKLREIKSNIRTGDGEKPFGNLAVFFLGDIMQLRPVKSEFYIFLS